MSEDFLIHYGTKGQKWGVRRYQNQDGSLTEDGYLHYGYRHSNRNKTADTVQNLMDKKIDREYNLDKFGQDADHNLLFITGLSGSGKSTMARSLQDSDSKIEIIPLDRFYGPKEYYNDYKGNEEFIAYLDKKVPEYSKMMQSDRFTQESQYYSKVMHKVTQALKEYAHDQYGNKSIVAEGIQLLDDSMYDNLDQKVNNLKDVPIVIKGTGSFKSSMRAILRDAPAINSGKQFVDYVFDRSKSNAWLNNQLNSVEERLK